MKTIFKDLFGEWLLMVIVLFLIANIMTIPVEDEKVNVVQIINENLLWSLLFAVFAIIIWRAFLYVIDLIKKLFP